MDRRLGGSSASLHYQSSTDACRDVYSVPATTDMACASHVIAVTGADLSGMREQTYEVSIEIPRNSHSQTNHLPTSLTYLY